MVAPVKYESDLKDLHTDTFAKLEISLMEKLGKRKVVPPTPDS